VRWFDGAARVLPDVRTSLWRALAVYRVLVLGYAAVVIAQRWPGYRHPLVAGLVLAGMAAWTAACTWAYSAARRRRLPLLCADLAAACGAVALTVVAETPQHLAARAPTLPTLWASASILAWGLALGVPGGAVAAAADSIANVAIRPHATTETLANIFLLLLAGIVVGYVSTVALAAEAAHTRAAELSAAAGERERLARSIHDGVLQVLALVQRPGGVDATGLRRLAAEQERRLRALIAGGPERHGGRADLGRLLHAAVAERQFATLAAPAPPVWLGGHEAEEIAAATAEALENVRRHAGAGARAWVLVEDEPAAVTVTVRDDGVGMPDCRLAEARAEGRLGVAQSIVARMGALGGDASVTSVPGQGTEVELRLPRRPAP
jgi:signal transduction histidine kinase